MFFRRLFMRYIKPRSLIYEFQIGKRREMKGGGGTEGKKKAMNFNGKSISANGLGCDEYFIRGGRENKFSFQYGNEVHAVN